MWYLPRKYDFSFAFVLLHRTVRGLQRTSAEIHMSDSLNVRCLSIFVESEIKLSRQVLEKIMYATCAENNDLQRTFCRIRLELWYIVRITSNLTRDVVRRFPHSLHKSLFWLSFKLWIIKYSFVCFNFVKSVRNGLVTTWENEGDSSGTRSCGTRGYCATAFYILSIANRLIRWNSSFDVLVD